MDIRDVVYYDGQSSIDWEMIRDMMSYVILSWATLKSCLKSLL